MSSRVGTAQCGCCGGAGGGGCSGCSDGVVVLDIVANAHQRRAGAEAKVFRYAAIAASACAAAKGGAGTGELGARHRGALGCGGVEVGKVF